MGTRGRKSTTELETKLEAAANVAHIGSRGADQLRRPAPPPELSEEQATEWRALVNAGAVDKYPRPVHPMLAAYCRHTVAARRVAAVIRQLEEQPEIDLEEYDRLLKMQERESRCLSSLAVRLGMAQSRYGRSQQRNGRHPWEFTGPGSG